jgi:hypothetical protein
MACLLRDEDAHDLVIFVRLRERSAHTIWSLLVDDLDGIRDSRFARTEIVVNCFLGKSYMRPRPPTIRDHSTVLRVHSRTLI